MKRILKSIILSVTLLLFISSCTFSKKKDTVQMNDISPVDSLSVLIGLPLFAEFYDHKLFIMDIYGEEGFIKVVDTEKDSLLFSLAKRGEGPNEYLHVGNINICEDETNGITLGIYDPVLKAYRTYSYDSLCMQGGTTLPISTGHLPRESRYTELLNLNSAWLATDLTGKGRFVLLDDSLKNERYMCDYRPKPIESVPDALHAIAHHGRTAVSPDHKTIANVIYLAEVFSVFRVDHNEVVPAWDYVIKEMDYRIREDQIESNTPLGYLSVAMGEKCIYGLFCGKEEDRSGTATYADEIHVFSYDGRLIKKLHLATSAFGICIDSKEQMLYTVVHEPEPKILIYHLPE